MEIEIIPVQKNYEVFLEKYPPVKASSVPPEWYRKMKRNSLYDSFASQFDPVNHDFINAKSCPAINDIINTGIVIPMWATTSIKTLRDVFSNDMVSQHWDTRARVASGETIDEHITQHTETQIEGMELNTTASNSILKIKVPYKFIVPEGYNLLFIDPFYHFRQDIRCLPGLIESDKWGFVTLPFEILNDDVNIEAGTPLVQVIPVKRYKDKLNLTVRNGTDKEYETAIKEFSLRDLDGKNYRSN